MASARTNPLKPGVYWLDVWRPNAIDASIKPPGGKDGEPIFQAWLAPNVRAGKVETVQRTLKPVNGQPLQVFYVFQVKSSPTDFPFVELGFPTIHKLGSPEQIKPVDRVLNEEDTSQVPPPEPQGVEAVGEYLDNLVTWTGLMLAGYLAVQLVLSRSDRK